MATTLTAADPLVSTINALLAAAGPGALVVVSLKQGNYTNDVVGTVLVGTRQHLRLLGPVGDSPATLSSWSNFVALRITAAPEALVEIARVDFRSRAPIANTPCLRLGGAPSASFLVDSCAFDHPGSLAQPPLIDVSPGIHCAFQNLLLRRDAGSVGGTGIMLGARAVLDLKDSAIRARNPSRGEPVPLSAGVQAGPGATLQIENCWFESCTTGVDVAENGVASIEDCRFVGCADGVVYGWTEPTSSEAELLVRRCLFQARPEGGPSGATGVSVGRASSPARRLALSGPVRTVVESCVFERLEAGIRVTSGLPVALLIEHNTFVGCSLAGVDLAQLSPRYQSPVQVPVVQFGGGLLSSVTVPRPLVAILNNIFLIAPVIPGTGSASGGVLVPFWAGLRAQRPRPVEDLHGEPILIARNLFRATTAWSVWTAAQVLRVFVRLSSSMFADVFWSGGWQYPGTAWENPVSVNTQIIGVGGMVNDSGNDPALAALPPGRLDVHPTRIDNSDAIAASLPLRPEIGPGGLRPAGDLLTTLGFPTHSEAGYYGNERPPRSETTPGGPAIGASEPAGWAEFPLMIAQVSTDDLRDPSLGPTVALACDVVQRAAGFPLTNPGPGPVSPAAEAAHWLQEAFYIEWLQAVDALGLKGIVGIPMVAWTDLDPGLAGVSPAGVSQGVSFSIPWGKNPSTKDQIRPGFAVWLSSLLPFLAAALRSDPAANRALIGFWGPEEFRPNPPYQWTGYYTAQRLRRALDRAVPGAMFVSYLPNDSAPSSVATSLGASNYYGPPIDAPGVAPNLHFARMGGPPTSYTGSSIDYASALFQEVGVDDLQLRWHIYDARGFPADVPGFNAANQATWPRDAEGNDSVFLDPDPTRWPIPEARASKDLFTTIPFLDGGPVDDNVDTQQVADRYRPWQNTSSYFGSWYTLTDGLGFVPPVMDHYIAGNYVDRVLGWNTAAATTNRIIAYHRAQGQLEGRLTARQVFAKYRQQLGDCKIFHTVELNTHQGDGQYVAPATAAHGRHDFWVGMHDLNGAIIHLWGERRYRDASGNYVNVPGWNGYEESLRLVKSTLREFLVAGERIDVGFQMVSGTPAFAGDYLNDVVGYVPSTPFINVTGFRLRDKVAVVVTSSFDQVATFRLGLSGLLASATSVASLLPAAAIGISSTAGNWEFQASGIDGAAFLFHPIPPVAGVQTPPVRSQFGAPEESRPEAHRLG